MATEVLLPDLGEGIEKGEVTSVLVKVGDIIEKDQNLLEMETDKALFEVPSTAAGKIVKIHFKDGDVIKVGAALVTVEESEVKAEEPAAAPPPEEPKKEQQVEAPEEKAEPVREPQPEPEAVTAPAPPEAPALKPEPVEDTTGEDDDDEITILAGPATRRLARELGVDLSKVKGSEAGGRISKEDVKEYAKSVTTSPTAGKAASSTTASTEADSYGPIEKTAFKSVRKKTAEHVSHAWKTIPHVTQFDKANITELSKLMKNYNETNKLDVKLTLTAFAVKAVVALLKEFPQVNATLNEDKEELILKHYYNIGIAADTKRGLMVPVVKNADRKSLAEIAREITTLAEQARDGKIPFADLQGGTFTITNLGGIGGTYFTPIVNSPEAAILGMSRGGWEPVVVDGEVTTQLSLPYCLSYDHRIIDGADGARFTRRLAQILENPVQFLVEG